MHFFDRCLVAWIFLRSAKAKHFQGHEDNDRYTVWRPRWFGWKKFQPLWRSNSKRCFFLGAQISDRNDWRIHSWAHHGFLASNFHQGINVDSMDRDPEVSTLGPPFFSVNQDGLAMEKNSILGFSHLNPSSHFRSQQLLWKSSSIKVPFSSNRNCYCDPLFQQPQLLLWSPFSVDVIYIIYIHGCFQK